MTYDLFHQLLYLSSNQDDSSEFLEKLEHMTATDVAQAYASLQISSRNPFPASGMTLFLDIDLISQHSRRCLNDP